MCGGSHSLTNPVQHFGFPDGGRRDNQHQYPTQLQCVHIKSVPRWKIIAWCSSVNSCLISILTPAQTDSRATSDAENTQNIQATKPDVMYFPTPQIILLPLVCALAQNAL